MTDFLDQFLGQKNAKKASILQHIQCLLSQRLGSLIHMPDYGMPDLDAHLNFSEVKSKLISGLKNAIETYEPRISQLLIEEVSDKQCNSRIKLQFTAILTCEDTLNFKAELMGNHQLIIQDSHEKII